MNSEGGTSGEETVWFFSCPIHLTLGSPNRKSSLPPTCAESVGCVGRGGSSAPSLLLQTHLRKDSIYSALFCSVPSHPSPFHFTAFDPILSYPILFHPIPSYSTLSYSIPLQSVLAHPISSHPICSYPTPFHQTQRLCWIASSLSKAVGREEQDIFSLSALCMGDALRAAQRAAPALGSVGVFERCSPGAAT